MRKSLPVVISIFALCTLGCIRPFGGNLGGGGSFGDVTIPGTSIVLEGAQASSEPMPTPTGTGYEPVIVDAWYENTGADSFQLVIETTGRPSTYTHLEINGDHYVVVNPDADFTSDGIECDEVAQMTWGMD